MTGNITVDYGGTTDVVLSSNQAAEFVFCKDLDTGNHKWFVTQSNVVTKY